MEQALPNPPDHSAREAEGSSRYRRWRLVPPAVTPVTASDLRAGAIGHLRGTGRDRLCNSIETFHDAEGSATYTSFRRTLGACFQELTARADHDRRTVLIPAFCSSDFPDAIEGVGLEPVRYDIEPETLSLDVASLTDTLEREPLAVVAVNVLGYSSPMAEIASLAEDADAYLVEALGYALGATYENLRLGTFGDCAVLNFQQGKPIPVGGGMVVSQNPEFRFTDEDRPAIGPNAGTLAGYAALSRSRPYYGYRRLMSGLEAVGVTGRVTTHPESKTAVTYAPPYSTISNFQGAIGRRIFDRLPEHRERRAATARYYADGLSDEPALDHVTPIEGLSGVQYVRYPIRLRTSALRDAVQSALRDAGVQATTLYDWPVLDADTFPGAARLQQTILTLPTHPYVDDRDRRLIVHTIRSAIADAEASQTANRGGPTDAPTG
jgi:dTDP-4-amino-4,6-dideoxygalactose transaminase